MKRKGFWMALGFIGCFLLGYRIVFCGESKARTV